MVECSGLAQSWSASACVAAHATCARAEPTSSSLRALLTSCSPRAGTLQAPKRPPRGGCVPGLPPPCSFFSSARAQGCRQLARRAPSLSRLSGGRQPLLSPPPATLTADGPGTQ